VSVPLPQPNAACEKTDGRVVVGMSRPHHSPDAQYQTNEQPPQALIRSSLQIGADSKPDLHFRRNGTSHIPAEVEVRQFGEFTAAATKRSM
jgi:hypothetical protein